LIENISTTEPPPKEAFPVSLPRMDINLFRVWQEAFEKIGGVEALVAWAGNESNKKKFFEMGVALQPKNIKVEQEHRIRFVEVPMKVSRPELRKGSDVIDALGVEISNSNMIKGTAKVQVKRSGNKITKAGKEKKLKRDAKISADRKKEGIDGFNG
jgi:hypothetical protein